MSEQLHPKPKRKKSKSHLPWRVDYDLAYDGGGSRWSGYYRTKIGAKVAAWREVHISSWGGSAILIDQHVEGIPNGL